MRTVRVRLAGGLGNQLFQYSAGFLLANRTNRALILDDNLVKFEKAYKNRNEQGFKQNGVRGIVSDFLFSKSNLMCNFETLYRLKDKGFEKIKLVENRNYFGSDTGSSVDINQLTLDSSLRTILLQGNLQSSEVALEAKKLGSIDLFTNSKFGNLDEKKPIIVHVRLSDYRVPNSEKYMVGPEYYKKSLDVLNYDFKENPIWLFSDEPAYAIKYIPREFQHRITFINDPKMLNDTEELVLMSRGIAYVNTNSTFSFWAAFLSNAEMIIAPTPWFKGSEENQHTSYFNYPKEWVLQEW